MFKPFFSVVIPTFNRRILLERAINSVIKQTLKDFELIIIDDGSTDDTSLFLDRLKSKYKGFPFFVIQQKNKGVSAARNAGIIKARGDWVAFLDSDDEWNRKKLEVQKNFILGNPEFYWVHGNEKWIRNGKFLNQKNIHLREGGDIFIRSLGLCLVSPSTVVVKKEVLKKFGGFDETLVVCEDYDLWLKISNRFPVGFCREELVIKYGGHEDQLSSQYIAMDFFRVLSIDRLMPKITSSKNKVAAVNTLLDKCRVLIDGYKKHNNLDNLSKVEYIYKKYNY